MANTVLGIVEPAVPAVAGERMRLLLTEHREAVLSYARRHIPVEHRRNVDPQDVLQDTMVECFRRLHEFAVGEPGTEVRWLLTVARNKLLDTIRNLRADKRGGGRFMLDLGTVDPHGRLVTLLEELSVYERTPSQSAIAHEVADALQRAIDGLPPDYRQAIIGRYIDQRPTANLAAEMGRTKGAMRKLYGRALDALRVALETNRPTA